MINRIYRLVGARRIEIVERELDIQKDMLVIRPEYLSICAADQRYYWGKRKKEILKKKLPLALIHEGTGVVLYDQLGKISPGTRVVMIPNIPDNKEELEIKENYRKGSKFCSSSADGFLQDILQMPHDRVIVLPSDDEIYVLTELLSVSYNAVNSMEHLQGSNSEKIGIWGDGNVGYATAVVLRERYPEAQIYVFGKHEKKLQYFSFVNGTYCTDDIPEGLILDQCYECVGGVGSEEAIEQMIIHIKPQGSLALMGVNEEPVRINTRMVLEKGLHLVGHSRSGKEDFMDAVALLQNSHSAYVHMRNIVSKTLKVHNADDICEAFEQDSMNDFKTVMKWGV